MKPPAEIPRRRFLALSVVTAGAVLGGVACASKAEGGAGASATFPQSVASGDPRPFSIVLWTRVVDADRAMEDLQLSLEVALDDAFSRLVSLDGAAQRSLVAQAAFDHCVKTRVDGLDPGTTYFYRFSYGPSGRSVRSPIGRTKTAPADDADVPVRFAVVSCQDYAGKYYHAYRHLAEQDLDLIVHLGDYIYETTADPAFQSASATRQIEFGKQEEALTLGTGSGSYQAARSLDNYRDLYRIYKSDPDLQAAHERFPMIATQDDHEFSDDCHADFSNYTDGRETEQDTDRRLAADQAWFEYMPVDLSDPPTRTWDGTQDFPDQLRYYRSFVFGRHCELVMTDLRRYRPDHLVPEDAFPGSVFLEQAALVKTLGALPDDATPYVNIDEFQGGAYKNALQGGADTLGISQSSVQGLIGVSFINAALGTLGLTDPAPIATEGLGLSRGYIYEQLLKMQEYSRLGARYLVALGPFNALAKAKFDESTGASERLMGDEQRAWFLSTMKNSSRTFKIWGSEVCFMARHLDLTPVSLAPAELRVKLSISAEDWDGFPNEREALLEELGVLENVVIVSGDLHCFFAGTPYAVSGSSTRVVEFVTGSLTSTTWQRGLVSLAGSNSGLPASTQFIAANVGSLLGATDTRPNPHLSWQNLADNGYGIFEASGERLAVSFFSAAPDTIATAPNALGAPLSELFARQDFEVVPGAADLFRTNADGMRERWDIPAMSWLSAG